MILDASSAHLLIIFKFQDMSRLLLEHSDDSPTAAITGKYILELAQEDEDDCDVTNDVVDSGTSKRIQKQKTNGAAKLIGPSRGTSNPSLKANPGRMSTIVDDSVPPKQLKKKPNEGTIHNKYIGGCVCKLGDKVRGGLKLKKC